MPWRWLPVAQDTLQNSQDMQNTAQHAFNLQPPQCCEASNIPPANRPLLSGVVPDLICNDDREAPGKLETLRGDIKNLTLCQLVYLRTSQDVGTSDSPSVQAHLNFFATLEKYIAETLGALVRAAPEPRSAGRTLHSIIHPKISKRVRSLDDILSITEKDHGSRNRKKPPRGI